MTFGGPAIREFLRIHEGRNTHEFTQWAYLYDNILQKNIQRTRWCIKCKIAETEVIE
jgi:hypothetical protein